MKFIWYNPDINAYQKGSMDDYNELCSFSTNADRFDILYEFDDTADRLIDKILNSLNMVRSISASTN